MHMRFLTLALMSSPCAAAALAQPANDKELERLQGTWSITKIMTADKITTKEFLATGRVVIKGDRLRFMLGDKELVENSIKLDASTKPKRIDMTPLSGDLKGKTSLGVYALDGDLFILLFAEPGLPRPKSIPAKLGGKKGVVILKRLPP